jgi:hypothetical protein
MTMLYKQSSSYVNVKRIFISVTAVLTFLLVAGCAGGNYGSLDRDRELDNMFLRYEVLPDHNYYATGGYDAPAAILAIHKDYELVNTGNLWVRVPNVNYAQMRKWVNTIAPDQNYRRSSAYFAAYILNPEGERVGAWYAIESSTTVKFLENNKIQVYPPNLKQDFELNRDFRKWAIWGSH